MPTPIKFLKPDLKVMIDRVRAEPGDVLVVRPKDAWSRFTPDFSQFLQDTLAEVLPPGVRGMIVADDAAEFVRLTPTPPPHYDHLDTEIQDAFSEGWRAAFDALEQFYAKPEPDA